MLYRLWRWLAHLWREDATPMPEINAADLAALRAVEPFDWLRDYGPLWWPGSAAFWLEPDNARDVARWEARYGFMRTVPVADQLAALQQSTAMMAQRENYLANMAQQQAYMAANAQNANNSLANYAQQAHYASQVEQMQNALNHMQMYPHRSNPLYDMWMGLRK